ncbi:MAG: hypothetical protein Q8Q56_01930, partial [Alphaproteobacteria bacterium]|nr:hypothetical protein [Alphaproteobacteria bacterium]
MEQHLNQINAPWFAIGQLIPMEADTAISKQVAGRFSFIQRILDSVEHNIIQINTCPYDHSLKATFKAFDFEKLGVLREDVAACRMNGIAAIMELVQEPPKPSFGELFGLAVLGVLQGIAGVTLMLCGCVNIGASLISECVSDLWMAIDSALNDKSINWEGYLKNKAIAMMMAVGAAAWSALSEGAKAAKEAIDKGKKSFGELFKRSLLGEGEKVVRNEATGAITRMALTRGELGWKAATAIGTAMGKQVVGVGVAKIRNEVIHSFQSNIEASAQRKMKALFEEPGFKAEISQVHRFDSVTQSQWKVRQKIQQSMAGWQGDNNREVIEFIRKVVETISRSDARSTSWTQLGVSAAGEMGMGAYNISVAYTFMDEYIKALKTHVHQQAAEIMEIVGVTARLLSVRSETA